MTLSLFKVLPAIVIVVAVLPAEKIEGTIVIKHKLTKRSVTAEPLIYQRGPSVELGVDSESDPLAFERARVVIYLEGELPSKPVTATLEQTGRRFVPDTLVIPVGSTISFPNSDVIFHNVFSLSKSKTFDLGNYPKGGTRAVTFGRPGLVFVNCHLHPNMSAAIVVCPNSWSTKADASGRFVLRDVPPGKYKVVAWHKAAGFFRQSVEVFDKRNARVDFLIPLEEHGVSGMQARR